MHGSGRQYANGLQRHNGQGNRSQQSNDERSMAACALKPHDEGQANGHQKDEQQIRGHGWPSTGRPNGNKRSNAYGYQTRRGFSSTGDEVNDHLQAPSRGNVEGRGRGYGRRSEVNVFEDKLKHGSQGKEEVSGGIEKVNEESDNVYKEEKEYGIRNMGGLSRI